MMAELFARHGRAQLGHPVPTGSPMGLPTFFFLLPHFQWVTNWVAICCEENNGLKFPRTILMDILQVEVKNGLAEIIFHRVI